MTDRRSRSARRRRGNVSILVAVMLSLLLGFVALTVDVGNMYRVKTELQSAVDSAALAGAGVLNGTAAQYDAAKNTAVTFANSHRAYDGLLELTTSDVTLGHWDTVTSTFTPDDGSLSPASVNAVKVEALESSVEHSFAPVIGQDSAQVRADAIAVGGGPLSECGFPMVVPDCLVEEADISGTCEWCMQYQNNNDDTAAWTTFSPQGDVGGPAIKSLIMGACTNGTSDPPLPEDIRIDSTSHECTATCTDPVAGENIQLNNGNLFNPGAESFCELIQTLLLRGGEEGVVTPQYIRVRVPVIESTVGTCDADQLSGQKTIGGYAVMDIYSAQCSNSDAPVTDPNYTDVPVDCSPPSGKHILGALQCDVDSSGIGGGGNFGIETNRVRLVQ